MPSSRAFRVLQFYMGYNMKTVLFMNLPIIVLTVFIAQCTNETKTPEYIGTFTSIPEHTIGFSDPISEQQRDFLKRLKWKLVITEDELTVQFGQNDHLTMTYFIEGQCIVGRSLEGDSEMYMPLYFRDKDTVFGWGQEFIRVSLEEKNDK